MDKITIVLQDKQTIEKLAADPNVQLRIKDAIIDGIGRRGLKLENVTKDILDAAESYLRYKFLNKGGWNGVLKEEFKKIVDDQCREAFRELVKEEILTFEEELSTAINGWKERIKEDLNNYDLGKTIRVVVEEVVREKFSK